MITLEKKKHGVLTGVPDFVILHLAQC